MTEAVVLVTDDDIEVIYNVDKMYGELLGELLRQLRLRPASKHVYQQG